MSVLLQTSDVKINKLSSKGNVGIFEFSPLPSGFGQTLGSVLRRVLLTSLKGGAATEVRIPKVSHQFSTVAGVKEDVVEITLNIKELVVKIHTDNPVIGSIHKKGKGPVTAADIEVSSDIEIINKDLHIAELADNNSTLDMDITFESGVGYSAVEDRKTAKVGVIMIDAVFSPVLQVSYEVAQTRKGDITGLDKLTLTVTTDGSIAPEEALTEASTTLRNFFSRFAKGPDPELVIASADGDESGVQSGEEIFLEDLSLPTRTINALKKHGISTLQQLGSLSDEELADVKNLGDKSVNEIKKILEKEGLK